MDKDKIDIKRMIDEDPDYINIPSARYSVEKILKKYPDGCPDSVICTALNIHHSDLVVLLKKVLDKIKKGLE